MAWLGLLLLCQVPTDLKMWKHALAEGHPIIFGLYVYDSFEKQRKKGACPLIPHTATKSDGRGAACDGGGTINMPRSSFVGAVGTFSNLSSSVTDLA